MNQNIRRAKAAESKNKMRLLAINTTLDEKSGIYFLTRTDENGIKYAYIGQAKHLLTRLAQHLVGYQHIDLSLRKHGLYAEGKEYGWNFGFLHYPLSELDEKERYYITLYAQKGYQMRNKDTGGGAGKQDLGGRKEPKGYRDGLIQGRKNASREIANLFEKHLVVSRKSEKPNKIQEKALAKFNEFLEFHKAESEG